MHIIKNVKNHSVIVGTENDFTETVIRPVWLWKLNIHFYLFKICYGLWTQHFAPLKIKTDNLSIPTKLKYVKKL